MPQGTLLELKLEITRDCPLECVHCSSDAYSSCPEHLPTERVLSLLQEFAHMGGHKVCISGGEPLRHDGLKSILLFASELGLSATLYTCGISYRNGGLKSIPSDVIDTLVQTDTRAILSVHGATPSTHDGITGVDGSFRATLEALRNLTQTGVSTQAHVVPMLPNFLELERLAGLLAEIGADGLSWLRFVPQGRGSANRRDLELGTSLLRRLIQTRAMLSTSCPGFGVRMGAPFNVLCGSEPAKCGAATDVITVRPDGTVAPCDGFKQIRPSDPYGSVLKHSLKTVYRESTFLSQVRATLQQQTRGTCATCSLRARCLSGCLAQRVATAGWDGDERDPACPFLSRVGLHDHQTAPVR